MISLGAALCLLSCVAAAVSMGLATGKAVDAVARQPEASGKINSILLLGLAITESTAIYGFVTALLLLLFTA
ncbi:MAG: ATP synthase F0 subunit C [Oscillospiraceae bacterium]|jgi:F-type H+-transporting ATPase subunit c|nr:ATP synthase F0 subunit C [Oscillospiraceae bacterium]